MRIISVRRGLPSDHSSTSYEFLAVDKPLDRDARDEVASLSSRASPTKHRVSFVYHADGYDIPGGWEPLLGHYYDVMWTESYDWWTLGISFNAPEKQREAISQYEFYGTDDLGVTVSTPGERVVIGIQCRLDSGYLVDDRDDYGYGEYDGYDEDEEDEEDDEYEEPVGGDGLLEFLVEVREQLMVGDYRPLYAVWEVYGREDDEDDEDESEAPPVPPDMDSAGGTADRLRDMLATP